MGVIGNLDESTYISFLDEPITNSQLGVTRNRIIEVPNFVTPELARGMVKYFNLVSDDLWGDIAFYNSKGMGLPPNDPLFKECGLEENFFESLREQYKYCVSSIFDRPVRPNTSHAQKWDVGGFASPHSDNSDFDGNPTAFEINKYVGILYLNEDYEGGELFFDDHGIEIKPNSCSYYVFPGGIENIHGVREITKGQRYTMVSFWDFEEAEYTEERKAQWAVEFTRVREEQLEQRTAWDKGETWS
jgi:hypothetical protein